MVGHNSLPWPREARGGGGHVPPVGAGREREGGGGAAGGGRCRRGCRSLNETIDGAVLDGRGWVQGNSVAASRAQGRRFVVAKAFY